MASPTSDAPESPLSSEEWVSVADAAGRLGISTKTLRKRMARGEVAFRRVVLARGGAAYEVEMASGLESEMERSKPMFQTDASKFQSDFQTEGQAARNGSRFGSRNGTPSRVNRSGLEVEMESEVESSKPTSISVSKPMPESSKPALEMESEVARLRADLERERDGAAFLRGVIEQLQRDGAEVRAALRKALELAPKQLLAPDKMGQNGTDSSARNAPQSQLSNKSGSYDGAAQKGGESLSYGELADMLEALEKETNYGEN